MDPFATLGLARSYEVDPAQLEANYRELQRTLHPDRHMSATVSERRMNLSKAVEVNEAYRTLKDELRRAEALLVLHGGAGSLEQEQDPEFLMEVMELREGLAEAKASKDLGRVEKLRGRVESMEDATRARMAEAFSQLGDPVPASGQPAAASLQPIVREFGRLRYYRRFLDEVSAIEEEALL